MGKYYLRVNFCKTYSHDSWHAVQWTPYVCANWWVLTFKKLDQQPWVTQKTFHLLGWQWNISAQAWNSFAARVQGMILLPSSRDAACINICDLWKTGKKEQEHEQNLSRSGWENGVFDKAGRELQGNDCFVRIHSSFLFFPLVGVYSRGFSHLQNGMMAL